LSLPKTPSQLTPKSDETDMTAPTILIFDSGLGGLSVYAEVIRAVPHARYVYVADNAAFPYGGLSEDHLTHRVTSVMAVLIGRYKPDIVIIACSTASTLVLPLLRETYGLPFIGTVPAIKPAAEQSRSRMISVLATSGTAKRQYTQDLIRDHAMDCDVTLVGSRHLALLAEDYLHGKPVSNHQIREELLPCFQEKVGKRTDVITLSCTHYPLLLDFMKACAPWPVLWIDPAPAIARRLVNLMAEKGREASEGQGISQSIIFTGSTPSPQLKASLGQRGLTEVDILPLPLESLN
jgi:glutamate racemase